MLLSGSAMCGISSAVSDTEREAAMDGWMQPSDTWAAASRATQTERGRKQDSEREREGGGGVFTWLDYRRKEAGLAGRTVIS